MEKRSRDGERIKKHERDQETGNDIKRRFEDANKDCPKETGLNADAIREERRVEEDNLKRTGFDKCTFETSMAVAQTQVTLTDRDNFPSEKRPTTYNIKRCTNRHSFDSIVIKTQRMFRRVIVPNSPRGKSRGSAPLRLGERRKCQGRTSVTIKQIISSRSFTSYSPFTNNCHETSQAVGSLSTCASQRLSLCISYLFKNYGTETVQQCF